MIRLSRIWKLYLFYTIVLIAGVTVIGFIVDKQIARTLKGHLREDVMTLAKVIAKALPDTENSSVLNAFSKEYQKLAGVRLTIIRKDGNVMGESDAQSRGVENHLDRPEVQEALRGEIGDSIRYSETLKSDMFYVALPVDEKGRILRVAMPMTKVRTFESQVMVFFSVALYFMPILVMLAAFLFARYRIQERDKGG